MKKKRNNPFKEANEAFLAQKAKEEDPEKTQNTELI